MRFDKYYFDLRVKCKRPRRKWLKYWVLTLGAHGLHCKFQIHLWFYIYIIYMKGTCNATFHH